MSNHFCKVGNIRPNLKKSLNLNIKKNITKQFLEVERSKRPPKGFDVAS
ncbi:hypothetical protein CLV86_2670 [Lacinutrix venerupis]|nr:hypothetical protein CLV86_2670 [Lacinutrix venerupis]